MNVAGDELVRLSMKALLEMVTRVVLKTTAFCADRYSLITTLSMVNAPPDCV